VAVIPVKAAGEWIELAVRDGVTSVFDEHVDPFFVGRGPGVIEEADYGGRVDPVGVVADPS